MKLQNLASVRSGLVLSRKQAKEPSEYRYPLINLRCIQQEGTIQLKEADIYEAKEPLKEEYLSQSGDIIVRLTAPYTAVLIDKTTSGMVVSSNFVVIRVEDKSLLPEYLFWLLNTEKIKRKIYENATSNMLGAVNARFLADFELAILSVEDQRKIAQFNLMAKRERQLLRMLADEKQKYYISMYKVFVNSAPWWDEFCVNLFKTNNHGLKQNLRLINNLANQYRKSQTSKKRESEFKSLESVIKFLAKSPIKTTIETNFSYA